MQIESGHIVEIREVDRQVSWILRNRMYIKTTVLTERIPIDDVPTCKYCGDPMFDGRVDRQFCKDSHRIAAHRMQKRNGRQR